MKYELDATDERILEKLMEDSSKSLAQIARELDLPRPTVNYRIQRMRKEGIIRKFTIIRDYSRLGLGMTSLVFVRYRLGSRASPRELAAALAMLDEVHEVQMITGEWDILLKVRTGSLGEVGDLLMDKIRGMEGVDRTLTSSVLETVKD